MTSNKFIRVKFLPHRDDEADVSTISPLSELTVFEKDMRKSGFPLRIIRVAGEHCKETRGLLWKGKDLPRIKQNLGRELCVVAAAFSNLPCLMNTLSGKYGF